jgi:CheY-like chemotaxis protein
MTAWQPRPGRAGAELSEIACQATGGGHVGLALSSVDQAARLRPAVRAPVSRRVLVVDDEDAVAHTVAEMLRAVGHAVDVETASTNVLNRLAVARYDVIISDVRMPILDGPALWAAIRQRYPALGPRMIFVTGDLARSETRRFLANAGVETLAKPVRARAIRDVVERVSRT